MKNIVTILVCILAAFSVSAQDTFSIVAVDPETGEIGSAGASCVTGIGSQGIIDIITDIIPGRGGVNSQAWVCIPNSNLENAIIRMEAGDSPQEIIDWLLANDSCASQNFDPEYRQYGIVDLDGNGDPRTAGWTGSMTDSYKEDRQGPNYSVQGNILLDVSVIDNMEANFNNTNGTLADKLMAALQGANFAGADSRCLVDGTSSTTAYLLVYRADDDPNDPYLRLNVGQQQPGIEPIDILQGLYDDFLAVEDFNVKNKLSIYPNPASSILTISRDTSLELEMISVFDVNGKLLILFDNLKNDMLEQDLDISTLTTGVYFLKVDTDQGRASLKFVKQ
ncbi:MAG: DUF1028 domain-containing protein [Flavobacteriaceae bacterium]|nr:DUF1028 domain-containing protein [Flavobacteriaceae bacterium]